MRAIRGATTIPANTQEQIYSHTKELFQQILTANSISSAEELVSVIITVTPDVDAGFPARAVRETAGFELVPVMSTLEMAVPNALPLCIRMMVFTNIEADLAGIKHVYLNAAKSLRPDLANKEE